ncbi:MAG: hypothetical protein C0501_29030 [Isosphaera sp.]|nr:hypothetical protein [Isosphaera sp.]
MPTALPRLAAKLRAAHAAHPGRFRLAFLAVLAVAVAATSLSYAAKVAKPGDTGQQSRSAFLRWRGMVRDVFTGTNVYAGRSEYPNPPVMALILRPFAELPPVAGALTWFYAKVLMAVLAAAWVFRLAAGPDGTLPDAAKAAAVLVALPALIGDLTHNNVNIFILFLLAGCLELYRRGRGVAAGAVLGLAIACKVTPLLFLPYFVWKRAWRVVAGCLAGMVLWLAVVPGAVLGWDRNAELLTDWYKLMVERPVLKGEVTTEHPNQALPGVVYRLLTHSPSFVGYDKTPIGDIPFAAAFHNLCDIGRPAAWWVVKGLTAGFALAVVLLCRAPRGERCGWRFAAECGLIAVGMLLLSERTWKHHAVVLLIPAAALAAAVARGLPGRVHRFVVGATTAAVLLMALPGLFGPRAADLAMVYGTHTAAFLLLAAALGAVLACGLRESGGSGGREFPG